MSAMPENNAIQAQHIQRWAWGLGLLAVAVFVGFIALTVWQAGAHP